VSEEDLGWLVDTGVLRVHASFPNGHAMQQCMHVIGTAVPTMTCSMLQYGSLYNATKDCIADKLAHVHPSYSHLPLDKTSVDMTLPRMPDGLCA